MARRIQVSRPRFGPAGTQGVDLTITVPSVVGIRNGVLITPEEFEQEGGFLPEDCPEVECPECPPTEECVALYLTWTIDTFGNDLVEDEDEDQIIPSGGDGDTGYFCMLQGLDRAAVLGNVTWTEVSWDGTEANKPTMRHSSGPTMMIDAVDNGSGGTFTFKATYDGQDYGPIGIEFGFA